MQFLVITKYIYLNNKYFTIATALFYNKGSMLRNYFDESSIIFYIVYYTALLTTLLNYLTRFFL